MTVPLPFRWASLSRSPRDVDERCRRGTGRSLRVIMPKGPRRLTPAQVRYLAFEGGGAKGIAFIGALAALEALGVRPALGLSGSVLGVSGASAGSMTAFLYAMRFTPEQLIDIQMADKAFTRFFQRPDPNVIRAVNQSGYKHGHPMVRWVGPGWLPVTDKAKGCPGGGARLLPV